MPSIPDTLAHADLPSAWKSTSADQRDGGTPLALGPRGRVFVYDEMGDQNIGWTWRNPSMLYSVNPDTWAITAAPMAGTSPAQLVWSSGIKAVFDRQAPRVADTVTILKAVFRDRRSLLIVQATSSEAPAAQLLVTVPGCVTNAPLEYKPSTGHYHLRVRDCQAFDGQVATVTSSFGGLAAKITEWRIDQGR